MPNETPPRDGEHTSAATANARRAVDKLERQRHLNSLTKEQLIDRLCDAAMVIEAALALIDVLTARENAQSATGPTGAERGDT